MFRIVGWYVENSDANYSGCFELDDGRCVGPHPVGSKPPNAFGLYDMHGNVWEWCSDLYGNYPSSSVTDPMGPSSGDNRVLRGGCWYGDAWHCRSANRDGNGPSPRIDDDGFRLAAAPPVQQVIGPPTGLKNRNKHPCYRKLFAL
jgi:formylglycine-generating enzyme required for sulfatase activity